MKEKQTEITPEVIEVYSDGACAGNPGPGGTGYLVRYLNPFDQEEMITTGSVGYRRTTNNRMEMIAAIQGMVTAGQHLVNMKTIISEMKLNNEVVLPYRILKVISDSSYLCNCFNKGWIKNWIKSNWLTRDGKPVKNPDLLQVLEQLVKQIKSDFGIVVKFVHVPGHRGYTFNEQCDKLAVAARKQSTKDLEVDSVYEKTVGA